MAVILWKQFATSFLRSMAEKAVPVTEAVRFMRTAGISFRYTEMLSLYRKFAHLPEVRDAYKYIPKIYRLPKDLFGKPFEFMSRNFLYEGGFTLKDKETGKIFTKPARIASDYHLSQSAIERESLKLAEEGFDKYNWEVIDFEVTGAFAREETF